MAWAAVGGGVVASCIVRLGGCSVDAAAAWGGGVSLSGAALSVGAASSQASNINAKSSSIGKAAILT